MAVMIRRALPADAAAIAGVHVDTWRAAYRGIVPQPFLDSLDVVARAANWAEWLARPECLVFVAENSGAVCGFIAGGPLREPVRDVNSDHCDCEIYAIYILAEAQQRGIGRELMQTLARELAVLGLARAAVWVLRDNPACRFYSQLGARPVTEKPIEIGGEQLVEVAYAWSSMEPLLHSGPAACFGR